MAVRSKRLYLGNPVGTNTTLYECASGETTLIKSVLFRGRTGVIDGTVTFRINSAAANHDLYTWTGISDGDSVYWEPWLVLLPTDKLRFITSQANAIQLMVNGAELEGLAD